MFDNDNNSKNKSFINQLHAKIYIYTNSGKNWLTFGSANATNRGFLKNDEVLIELKAPRNFYENIKKYIENNKFFVELLIEEDDDLDGSDEDNSQEVLEELDNFKREVLEGSIEVKHSNSILTLVSNIRTLNDNVSVEVTPSSKVNFKKIQSILTWEIKSTEITGWFRFKLTKDGQSREFLLNDELFSLNDNYLKKIDEEAINKSSDYLKANIFSLLHDGNITTLKMREILKQEIAEDIYNHCSKNHFTHEYIYDLMLEKYAINKNEYNTLLRLLEKVDEYKPLFEILSKAKL